MKNDCIVCAKTFDDPEMERITCSKECSKKWQEFLSELKMAPEEEREIKIDNFFSRLYVKLIIQQGKQS
ncbi:MAG TPA: hypothetical protein DDY18_03975 [Flavobacterium sp.]|nr:hypothetical protein [Flavobacterium sp.]